jgi:drug/metabolite transporter (DMT)-like permease
LGSPSPSGRQERIAALTLYWGGVSHWPRASSTEQARSSPEWPREKSALGALGVFNTALAYYVYFRLVNEDGPTFASLNNYIVPLIGVMGGAVALAEPIAPSAWAGLALVLRGVALTGRSLRPAKAPRTA